MIVGLFQWLMREDQSAAQKTYTKSEIDGSHFKTSFKSLRRMLAKAGLTYHLVVTCSCKAGLRTSKSSDVCIGWFKPLYVASMSKLMSQDKRGGLHISHRYFLRNKLNSAVSSGDIVTRHNPYVSGSVHEGFCRIDCYRAAFCLRVAPLYGRSGKISFSQRFERVS